MRIIRYLAALVIVSCSNGYSQEKQTTSDTTAQTTDSAGISVPGVLTAKQISEFKTEWADEKKGVKYMWSATFSQIKFSRPEEKKKYTKSGKIPYRITCSLYEIKEMNGKPLYKLVGGSVKLAILTSDKKVELSKTASLDKMCPS